MSAQHADAVRTLSGWPAPDGQQEGLRTEFLALLAERPDATRRKCTPSHITASALVIDPYGERVLLALHRKVGLWLQMGGHCEPGDDSIAGAALREALEESGVKELRLSPLPIDLDKHPAPCAGGADWHFDVRFAAVAEAGAQPATSAESLDVRWFDVDDVPEATSPDLSRLVAAARAGVLRT